MEAVNYAQSAEVVGELEVVHLQERGVLEVIVGFVAAACKVCFGVACGEVVDLSGAP